MAALAACGGFHVARDDELNVLQFKDARPLETDCIPKCLLASAHRRATWSSAIGGPPLVIHCSAGIGRSGTYLLLDVSLNLIEASKSLDAGIEKYCSDVKPLYSKTLVWLVDVWMKSIIGISALDAGAKKIMGEASHFHSGYRKADK